VIQSQIFTHLLDEELGVEGGLDVLAGTHSLGDAELILFVVGQLPVPAEVVLLRFELSQLLLEHEHSEQGDSRVCCQVESIALTLRAALALEAV
jgi:hypothetical protein